MRVYYIKDYHDGICLNKKGSNSTLWDATFVLKNGYAIPWELRNTYKDEPQAEAQAEPQSRTKKSGSKEKKNKQK